MIPNTTRPDQSNKRPATFSLPRSCNAPQKSRYHSCLLNLCALIFLFAASHAAQAYPAFPFYDAMATSALLPSPNTPTDQNCCQAQNQLLSVVDQNTVTTPEPANFAQSETTPSHAHSPQTALTMTAGICLLLCSRLLSGRNRPQQMGTMVSGPARA